MRPTAITKYLPAHMRRMMTAALFALAALAMLTPQTAAAQHLNDKILNRPYADNRQWHLGFSVGLMTMGMNFHHNGFVSDEGQTWFMSQPAYAPGFCVNGVFSLRLNDYFSVRINPGIYFCNRDITFLDTTNGTEMRQNVKSADVVLPVDLKYSALRFRNLRPYVVGGIMPAFDVAKKPSDILKTSTADFLISVGFGCDIYLPYFKLIPEVKFCFGLTDIINHKRPDLSENPTALNINSSVKKATTNMVVLTFYFE